MGATVNHGRSGSTALLDAATIAQQLDRPPAEVVRSLRRCAREGLVTLHEHLGEDNPSVVRLTILGKQWAQQRLGM
jgi:hypothetical protein